MIFIRTLFIFGWLFASLFTVAQAQERPAKPNVILILTDDLGWQDVACYDIDEPCPFETPTIDRMAKQGAKFWQAYSPSPTCAPSRVAILSGKHPARSQKTHVVGGGPPNPHAPNAQTIPPWYSGRMQVSEVTIAEALKPHGYTSGCIGKWHCAINHHAFPQPTDQGFDESKMERGKTDSMKPHRLTGFATTAEDDPYRLDENGYPFHQNSADALDFVRRNQDKPFFLYYATWLVHTPIHTRSEAALKKYCKKMNVPYPTDPKKWEVKGQKNPFYGAMVESLDYYVGQLLEHLETTDDPRWPGHKLVENTYVIFTSDNGGMEGHPGEIITDNYPLDRGKINAKEGGVRVPLIIKGPGIPAGIESQALVNGLDFYPTILSWTGATKPAEQHLDGLDLSKALASSELKDMAYIKDAEGKVRDTMCWHFPHSVAMQSTLRKGNYKLIRNWYPYYLPGKSGLDLYKLYDEDGKRVDIEEANSLAEAEPERTKVMNDELESMLQEMKASPPFLNPICKNPLPKKDQVCTALKDGRDGDTVWVRFRENGNKVVKANLLYTDNGGDRYEEWYRVEAKVGPNGKASATLPKDATHYLFNLIDDRHYLVSHPAMIPENLRNRKNYSGNAIAVD